MANTQDSLYRATVTHPVWSRHRKLLRTHYGKNCNIQHESPQLYRKQELSSLSCCCNGHTMLHMPLLSREKHRHTSVSYLALFQVITQLVLVTFSLSGGEYLSSMYSCSVISETITITHILPKIRFFVPHFTADSTSLTSTTLSYTTEFGKITQIMAIKPFKVIQSGRFGYQWKAHIRLPISEEQ